MRVGVISDTHLSAGDDPKMLQGIIKRYLGDCSIILHAGDLVCLEHFYHIIPDGVEFIAVAGNMDQTGASSELPTRRIVNVGGKRIGLTHGYGSSSELKLIISKEWTTDKLDAVVFGHSHRPFNEIVNGRLMFNPGSATDKRSAPFASVGILEIGHEITGRIIKVEG